MSYLADSQHLIIDTHHFSRLTEKLVFNLFHYLNWQNYKRHCDERGIKTSESVFSFMKDYLREKKYELMKLIETNKKTILENHENQNRKLLASFLDNQRYDNTFINFLQDLFIGFIREEGQVGISQAELIDFEQIQNEKNLFDDFSDNVDKKYSDISHIQRDNSFEEKFFQPSQKQIANAEDYLPISSHKVTSIRDKIEKNPVRTHHTHEASLDH